MLAQGRKPSRVPRPHQPHKNVHRRSRPSNLSQPGAEPEKGSHCRTLSGKPQVPHVRTPWTKGTAATPKEAQQESIPPPAGGEEEDKAPPAQKERNLTHRNRDHQRWGPQPKHRRLAIVGEREAENRQTEQKRVHHKGSQGTEVKIPKKEQKSPN